MIFLSPPWVQPGGVLSGNVSAISTTRSGGGSAPPYGTLNLGEHVGDDPVAVANNRSRLTDWVGAGTAPLWLNQVHGVRVIEADDWQPGIEADALIARRPGQVATVMTADCVPVLLASGNGSVVAGVHAGWRGLAGGIVANTIRQMDCERDAIRAWIGPAISQAAYEVGNEVREAFVDNDHLATNCFAPNAQGRWQADLPALTMIALRRAGVVRLSDAACCTYRDSRRFYSHRREAPCGRMASMIWILPR